MKEELIKKAKDAQSVEALLELAKQENIDLTEEQAREYFAKLQMPIGELADAELDAVAGGGCYSDDGYLMTTIGYGCEYYEDYGEGAIGISGTCCRCKYWDQNAASQAIILGQPAPCRHPENKKK